MSPPARQYSPAERRWRLGLTAVLAVYGWVLLRSPDSYTWLDSLDLAIHETGHLVFAFGGALLTLLGGTLFQLVVPLAFAFALWRQGDRHGATIPLWWLGQSCWNVSVYIKDARAQELPLVGGGEHDLRSCWASWACFRATRRSGARCTLPECSSTPSRSSRAGSSSRRVRTGPSPRCRRSPAGEDRDRVGGRVALIDGGVP
jgi:hypothetical protein